MCFQGGKCDRPCVYQFQRWQPDNTEERQTTRREPGVEEQERFSGFFLAEKGFMIYLLMKDQMHVTVT